MEKSGKRMLSFLAAATMMLSLFTAAPENVISAGADYNITPVQINANTFPDATFRQYVKNAFDKDGNGTLDVDEIINARNVEVEYMGISSLKGIEYLTEVRGIYCKNNNISSLDLSNNKLLAGIWCSYNPLTELDFSGNPDLVWVYASFCDLRKLNVSKNQKMAYIECNSNENLGSINVSANRELEHLMCGDCGLTSLNIGNNPYLSHLDAFSNKLTSFDVSKNTKMKRLNIWNNEGLGNVDISKNKELQYYDCANNDVTALNVSNNPNLEKLSCGWNDIKTLDVSKNPQLVYLDCNTNPIEKLDVSKNPKLRFLQAFICDFPTLDITNNPGLIKAHRDGTWGDVYDGYASMWDLDYGDGLKYFLCFDNDVTLKGANAPIQTDSGDYDYTDITAGQELVTREAAIYTLYNLAGKPRVNASRSRFTDVVHGSWYEDAVIWGEEHNICFGFPDIISDTFGVGKWITRQDASFMLYRYSLAYDLYGAFDYGRTDNFGDYFEIDNYAWNSVTWAIQWNILIPKGNTNAPLEQQRIAPRGTVTRGEYEAMIKAMFEKNNMPIVPIEIPKGETVSVLYGDVNGDGKVDMFDLGALQCRLCNWNIKGFNSAAADVNLDGKVDLKDLGILQRYLCKWGVKLGVKQ